MENVEQFEGIAIIGMAGRFPGAPSVTSFWRNLRAGAESISFFSDEELLAAGVDASLLSRPDYVRAGGVLDGAELFDAGLFGISPREAELLDPQQRVFLECAWEALEDAAYDPDRYAGAVGVYAGLSMNSYFLHNLSRNRGFIERVGEFQTLLGSDKDFLPTRVSYKLNLRGPSVNVQTACSTSLVAAHVACQSLLAGECDMALAGGVSVGVPQHSGYLYQEGGIASPDGHCRAFDADAKGTVGGNGVGIVVLKRLSEALADGDRVYAVIRGTAANNDGSDKIGYTAPSTNGQAEVIAQGLAIANVEPETVTYIETHGTGTELGDPIEVAALTQVFRASTDRRRFCAIGSVKTNVGHLDAAAGVAGLIKTALALRHRELPPSLHFRRPNPRIDFDSGPFFVNTELRAWEPEGGGPLRAGVSSFGIGGTNVHAVLEEAPAGAEGSEPVRDWQLLVLSARTSSALDRMSEDLANHLDEHPEQRLADLAHTLQVGRRVLEHKRAVLCRTAAAAAASLRARDSRVITGTQELRDREVVLMFPGQGAQYPGMGRELYGRESVYRREFDACDEVLRPLLGLSLSELLYGGASEGAAEELRQTRITQPALFCVEYALARQLAAWGLKAEAMIGHSVGELVAACLAGVFEFEDALRLVAARGRLMQAMGPGAMLAVGLSEEEVGERLSEGLCVAAVNGPRLCAVSGTEEAVERLERELNEEGVWARRLETSHAFHSPMMEEAAARFVEEVSRVRLKEPQMRFISNVSGTWITKEEATSPEYWGRQLRQTVRFSAGLSEIVKGAGKILVEVGPGRGLSGLAREAVRGSEGAAVARAMKGADEEGDAQEWLQRCVGQVWAGGGAVDWVAMREGERRVRVRAPGYAFERERFWVEPSEPAAGAEQGGRLLKKPDVAEWFYAPSWRRSGPAVPSGPSATSADGRPWLVFADECGVGAALAAMLREQGRQVFTVTSSHHFSRESEAAFTVNPLVAEHYRQLLSLLRDEAQVPGKILHLWGVTPEQPPPAADEYQQHFERAQARGLHSLLYLTQALNATGDRHDVELEVVTTQAQEVTGEEHVRAEKATVLGACKVIPQEHARVRCRAVDVELADGDARRVARQLMSEVSAPGGGRVVAYRGRHRWEQSFEPVRVEARPEARRLRRGGVYLITGGTGGVGLALAEYLAREAGAKLVLVSRGGDEGEARAEAVRGLEAAGAEVLVLKADVSDEAEMRGALDETLKRFGRLDGVVHAAGLAGLRAMNAIEDAGPEDFDAHFLPKVHGLLTLEKVLEGRELDFALLTSSLASVLGGLGFFAYASANLFMDAYAHQRGRASSINWTSVNWDGWNFGPQPEHPATGHAVAELAMTPAEGAEVFGRILSLEPSPQLIVSTGSLELRLARWVGAGADDPAPESQAQTARHARPDLDSAYAAPRNDLEATVAGVWQELLGIEQVGIHDDFFELGGHSLLATQVISHLRQALRVEVPVRSIFERPTVAQLAAAIEEFMASEARQLPAEVRAVPAAAAPGPAGELPEEAPAARAPEPTPTAPAPGPERPPQDTPAITREVQVITRRGDAGPAPLSFAQQRLWFFQQLEPGSTAYNYPKAVRFKGPLDADVLRRSLGEVVRRHEVLRTTFRVEDGRPVQVVAPSAPLPFPVTDLRQHPEGEREALTEQFIMQESRKPFDLEGGPLLRAALLRLGEEEHVLLLVMHHIITDAWSLGVLIHEVATLYEAYSSGGASPLSELPVQYADYAVWQRGWLEGEVYERQLAYWRRQLAGLPPVLELPTDRPRPALQTTNGAYYWFELDNEVAESLRALSRAEGATLFMTLLAAFKLLLSRYTGQTDIAVGTPIAGRNRAEVEPLIGFFVNTLVLRTDLSGGLPFREAVRREREVCLGAYSHQDMPFEKLVEELQPERDLSHSPLFQVMFLLENASLIASDSRKRGLTFTPVEVSHNTSKFDLTLGFTETHSGLAAAFEYNTDLFDRETVEGFASHLTSLLAAAAADPDAPAARLPLLTPAERRGLSKLSAGERASYPGPLVHQLFERQAERMPEAVALAYEGQRLSYAELNARANQLAHYLRSRGAGPESIVGLCLERSPELVVSILAVLKAGGAYLPLEPTYPAQRLLDMVEDSGCRLVISTRALAGGLGRAGGAEVVLLDERQEEVAAQSAEDPAVAVAPENAAYCIYTSGSTGRPKGVVNRHAGLRNRLAWMQAAYVLGDSDAVLQKTPFSFDVSVWEFLWPLAAGARLVLARPGGHQDASYLVNLIEEGGITTLHFVPSMLRLFLEEEGLGRCGTLRLVVCSGEELGPELVARFHERLGWARLENLYGPTEASIDVTAWSCPPGRLSAVPIGRPIANTEMYVLDAETQPAPVGVAGELYIGGVGLARGYAGRPALTAERFVPDPFSQEPGARLYKTGDLGRWNRAGELEYLGRVDTQVKVRGFRIELGEVEAALSEHPSVGEAVVAAREARAGDLRLVAYVVPRGGSGLNPAELREHLRGVLPEYMVPSAFVELERLPVSAHGKLDRKALPEPEPAPAAAYEEPRGELEAGLARVWAGVLGVERVGAYDNFFDLGGHSLLVVEAQRRVREELGREVGVVEMFQFPTVSALARHLSNVNGDGDEKQLTAATLRRRQRADKSDSIAIIGMAGRFPGAPDLDAFWRNLRAGAESISFFSDEELLAAGVDASLLSRPDYVRAGGVLDGAELFDAGLFGVSPREAELLDPQQRVFLECAWEALEDAAYDPDRYAGAVGVYAGLSMNSYFLHNLAGNHEVIAQVGGFQALIGSDKDFLPTRVSYKLNLRGPSVNVQTACSTSLVAAHVACQSLLAGECDMALAGGVSVGVPQHSGYLYQEGGIASPDGHCRAFDADARGTVRGNGVGIVVLKRLSEALADGDRIYAVIRGTAANNDGSDKIGYTAPSQTGQSQAIAQAHAVAGVEPHTISYVEAHGTGTELGDPIEVAALTQVFGAQNGRQNFCAIGSVKTNVGHLDAAAGVAGLIKTALALRHRELPPSLHFRRPNPRIDFDSGPFFVNAELRPWESEGGPLRAGVSSFGIGGTNAHAVLEESPPRAEGSEPVRDWQLLVLSAKTPTALERMTERLAEHLDEHPEQRLADLAHTLQVGRRVLEHKRAVLCRDASEAAASLRARDSRVLTGSSDSRGREVVLMFPGQGAQYPGMGRELYGRESVYRREFDACDAALRPLLGLSLSGLLYGGAAEGAAEELRQTRVTQPALFCVEYALARQLAAWGLKAEAMIGHSVGELVAACLAGVFTVEDALRLVAARGRLMQAMGPGAMLSVGLPEEEVTGRLGGGLWVAAVNGPRLCAVSGTGEEVERLERELSEEGVWARRLETSHAFHSPMMEEAAKEFVREVGRVQLREPRVRFISNVSGRWITKEEATSPEYWGRQLRQTVRFWPGLLETLKGGGKLFVEAGPGRGLSALAREASQGVEGAAVARAMKGADEEGDAQEWLQRCVGQVWAGGGAVDWVAMREGERRVRVRAPGYAFERERFWVERAEPRDAAGRGLKAGGERRADMAEWFYVPSWKQSPLAAEPDAATLSEGMTGWLIFEDECGVGGELSELLLRHEQRAVSVAAGEQFSRDSDTSFSLDPSSPEHYFQLLSLLREEGRLPDKIVHLWGVSADGQTPPSLSLSDEEQFERAQARGLHSLLYLAQALAEVGDEREVTLEVVTTQAQEVSGTESLRPEKATVLGACKVIPQEHGHIKCRAVDVELTEGDARRVAAQLLAEAFAQGGGRVVAYRGRHRWEQGFEPVRVEARPEARRLRPGGVYLITGGFGGVGLALAGHLAAEFGARLVLVSRGGDEGEARAEAVRSLKDAGAGDVLALSADVSDEAAMSRVLDEVMERFGRLDGVVHAAGLAGGAVVGRLSPQLMRATFDAKVRGTQVLDRVLKGVEPDFLLLCSSHRSILGGLGRLDYAAANAYLDAYARASRGEGGRHVVSVNWDTWRDVGMAADAARQQNLDPAEAIQEGVYASEGVEAFARILSTDLPQVIVSPEDFRPRVEESESLSAAKVLEELGRQEAARGQEAATLHARPLMSSEYVAPRGEAERTLAGIWEKILGIAPVGIRDNYLELGGDSVLTIQIVARANQAGLKLSPRQMFEHQTIEELAAVAGTAAELKAEQGLVTGDAPLTPIQHWFFEQGLEDAHHFNQAVMLEVRSDVGAGALREVVAGLLAHHDALRMRFRRGERGWRQENAGREEAEVFEVVDLSATPPGRQRAAVEAEAERAQRSLDFERGPLVRAVLYEAGPGEPRRLLVVIHHLAVDAVSWRILLEDLQRGCEQLARGEAVNFGAKTTSYKQWAETLERLAREGAADDELPYWAAEGRAAAGRMPLDLPGGVNEAGSVGVVRVSLGEEETRSLLQEVGKAYNTSVEEALLAALKEAYWQWTGQARLLVDMEGHGREEVEDGIDVTRTVGWFTSIYPVLLERQEDGDFGAGLAAVKEEMRKVRRGGLGYGMLRYLSREGERLRRQPDAEIIFLYLGQLDRVIGPGGDFAAAAESVGAGRAPRGRRRHLLEVSSAVTGGRLEVSWNYSEKLHARETVERLAGLYLEALRGLIEHCQSPDAKGYTPSDFPEVSLSQTELDALIAKLG